jgi:hypothetical protein
MNSTRNKRSPLGKAQSRNGTIDIEHNTTKGLPSSLSELSLHSAICHRIRSDSKENNASLEFKDHDRKERQSHAFSVAQPVIHIRKGSGKRSGRNGRGMKPWRLIDYLTVIDFIDCDGNPRAISHFVGQMPRSLYWSFSKRRFTL